MGNNVVYVVLSLLCCGILLVLAVVVGLIFAFNYAYNQRYALDIVNERSVLAEGPYYDAPHQRLYYVDMKNMAIISYSLSTLEKFKAKVVSEKKPVTFVIRVKDTEDKFVIGLKGALALIQWDGKSDAELKPVEFLDVENSTSDSRCNDAKADPSNRLWVGTMGAQTLSDPINGNKFEKDKGKMFRIDYDGSKTLMVDKMQIPNGLEWSLDKKRFYLVDSLTSIVTEYEYNDQDGSISKLKEVYNLKEEGLVGQPNTLPDGMTIDSEGLLWIAVYGTSKVIRIDPKTGKKMYELQTDEVLQPTSVCFAGRHFDHLFVTSARVDWTDEFEKNYPKSGYLYEYTNLDVKGAGPSRPVKLDSKIVERCCNKKEAAKAEEPKTSLL